MYGIDLSGKVALVAGVANKWSIAWAVARALHDAGAQLVLPYLSDRERGGIEKLLIGEGISDVVLPPTACNVGDDDQIRELFEFVGDELERVDYFAHCIAFAPRDALQGSYSATSREAFRIALDISAYSLVTMTHAASSLMVDGGSVVTMSYMASEKVFPSYNVMGTAKAALEHAVRQLAAELGVKGIRVNALSPGPISTVSARGVKGFGDFLDAYEKRAPMKRNVTQEEVGSAALFLLSGMSSGITGEVIHVDAGYNIMGT
jgi:enoyl-[acyl-carrier protein] reductase I